MAIYHSERHVKMFARMYKLGIVISQREPDDPDVMRTAASKSTDEHK